MSDLTLLRAALQLSRASSSEPVASSSRSFCKALPRRCLVRRRGTSRLAEQGADLRGAEAL